ASSLFCESLLPDISSVIFSFEFYHLSDEVCPLQSLCQRGSERSYVENAATGRVDLSAFPARSSVINLHILHSLGFSKAEDLFSVFNLAWIASRNEHDCCRCIRTPLQFS